MICFDQYHGTMVTYNNQVRYSSFATLYSCTIDLKLEVFKNIRWTWHQEIRTPFMFLWHYLHYQVTDINQIYAKTSKHITLCYWTFIFLVKLKLTHWIPCLGKKVPLLFQRCVCTYILQYCVSYILIYKNRQGFKLFHVLAIPLEMTYELHLSTHWGRDKMAAIFQTIFSNAFSRMKMYMNVDCDFTEVCS